MKKNHWLTRLALLLLVSYTLLVVGVICAGLLLFILFCQYVWFR